MDLVFIEIECPTCDKAMTFFLSTRTDEINLETIECERCGKKILASLEFEEV